MFFFICSGDFHIYRRKKWKEKHYVFCCRTQTYTLIVMFPIPTPPNDTTFYSFMEEITTFFPVLWIRIQIFKNIHSRPGSGQLRIWNELEVKLLRKTDKIWQFLNKVIQLKMWIPFCQKNVPKKIISRHNMQPNTLTYGNTKLRFMIRILENIS